MNLHFIHPGGVVTSASTPMPAGVTMLSSICTRTPTRRYQGHLDLCRPAADLREPAGQLGIGA
jgi:hypothetical protein